MHRSTAKLIWNQPICMRFWWFCAVFLEDKSPLKKCLNFESPSRQKIIGQRFPIICSKIGHIYEACTYIPAWPKYLHSSFSLAYKKFSCRSLKISNHWKFCINLWFWDSHYSFIPHLEKLASRISVCYMYMKKWLLIFYRKFFVCREKVNEDVLLAKQVCTIFSRCQDAHLIAESWFLNLSLNKAQRFHSHL